MLATKRVHYRNLQTFQLQRIQATITNQNDLYTPGTDDTFSGAVKRLWLHVGKVTIGTQTTQIEKYLKKKFPNNTFTVEGLPQHPEARTISFKVGADLSLLEDLYNEAVWPKGVMVQQFLFRNKLFRPQNKSQQINQFE